MTEEFLKELKGISIDSLKVNEVRELRQALLEVLAKTDEWFKALAESFGRVALPDNVAAGRPPEQASAVTVKNEGTPSPARRPRGRPLKKIKVQLGKPRAPLINVGGADAETEGPKPAQIFENSYVSKEGPQGPAELPADHPRRVLNRQSSVTPEIDMSDFAEVERQMKMGKGLKGVFQ
jgi:hypothetical protein